MDILVILTPFSEGHILILLAAILLLFGGKKIPEMMGGIGKGMREFKKAMKDDAEPVKEVPKEELKKEITE